MIDNQKLPLKKKFFKQTFLRFDYFGQTLSVFASHFVIIFQSQYQLYIMSVIYFKSEMYNRGDYLIIIDFFLLL